MSNQDHDGRSQDPHAGRAPEAREPGADPEEEVGNPKEKGGFGTRAVVGLTYAALYFICLFWGRVPSAVFIAVESALCCHEFYNLTRESGKEPNVYIGVVATALFPFCALSDSFWMLVVLFLLVFCSCIWYLFSPGTSIEDVCATVFGPLYTGLMLSSIVYIRCQVDGFPGGLLCVGVVGAVMVNDSFAYMVGSRIGRHHLAPHISPNKTWEGLVAGLVGSVLVWLILWATGYYNLGLAYAIVCAVVTGIFGVFGDLVESRIKRSVGVKDSGHILPGHGGMLDRCDALIFGSITACFMLVLGGVI